MPALRFRQDVEWSLERVFWACRQAAAERGWEIQHSDETSRTLSFEATAAKVRPGVRRHLSLVVEEVEDGIAEVVVGDDSAETAEITELFAQTLERVLPEVEEPARPTPPPTRHPIRGAAVEDLDRLAHLHAVGELDDEEFRVAKEQLLAADRPPSRPPARRPGPPPRS